MLELAESILRLFPMPDPNWTFDYDFTASSSDNDFDREDSGSPVVDEILTGDDPRVAINSENGIATFVKRAAPNFRSAPGLTAEVEVACSGGGYAGFEVTLADIAILVMIHQSKVTLYVPRGGKETKSITVNTRSNSSNTKFRMVLNPGRGCAVYRSGTSIMNMSDIHVVSKRGARFLWWGQRGGTQVFRGIRYYSDGPIAP